MSSSRGRACYKCGNVGHYAGEALLCTYSRVEYLLNANDINRGLLVFRTPLLQL